MEKKFWLNSWDQGEIYFHKKEVNKHLQDFYPLFDLSESEEVFVPLCGKSLDLLWLRDQGVRVTGNEISPLALEAFGKENQLKFQREKVGAFEIFQDKGLRIFHGDFFALSPQHLAETRAVYDRASFVAMPPAMRTRYAQQLKKILPPSASMLLVSYSFDEKIPGEIGPPFSVSEHEIRQLFSDHFTIEMLKKEVNTNLSPRLLEAGLKETWTEVYFLRAI